MSFSSILSFISCLRNDNDSKYEDTENKTVYKVFSELENNYVHAKKKGKVILMCVLGVQTFSTSYIFSCQNFMENLHRSSRKASTFFCSFSCWNGGIGFGWNIFGNNLSSNLLPFSLYLVSFMLSLLSEISGMV